MNTTCFTYPSTSPGHAAWVPNPSCRGTFGIASLCLSTTLICIWSSVHRDIPLKRLSTFRSLLRDAPLVLVALFCPELLFYYALNQFLCARRLVNLASRLENFRVPSVEEHHKVSKVSYYCAKLTLKISQVFPFRYDSSCISSDWEGDHFKGMVMILNAYQMVRRLDFISMT